MKKDEVSIKKIADIFDIDNNLVYKAVQSNMNVWNDIYNSLSKMLPNFTNMSEYINEIDSKKWNLELLELKADSSDKNYKVIIQELKNIKQLLYSYNDSQYYKSKDARNHIINLWEEIQIDIIKQSFINPKNWIEFSFDKLPNNDLKVIITKLIGNLSKWCNASDFWWDIEDANKFDNTNRLKTWKEKRDINIFISDKIRNLKSMVNRQLKTKKDINFIKSTNKVWSLILR